MSTLRILSCGHIWFNVGLRSYKRHLAKDQNINNFSCPVGILYAHHGDDNDDGNNDVDDYIDRSEDLQAKREKDESEVNVTEIIVAGFS